MQKAKDYVPRAEPYMAVMSGFENPRQQFTDEVNALNSMVIEDIEGRSVGEPTPFTAGRSLRGVLLSDLLRDPDAAASDLPILSNLRARRNSRADVGKEVELSELAALAPGVMMMLGSLAPQDGRRPDIIKALKENPLPEDAHSIDREDLDRFERSAPMILPITRALIPQTGAEIQEKFEQVKAFLA
jgi:hypothetical protein